MSRRDKQIERMRENLSNVRFDEIATLLRLLGFDSRQRGSHVVFTNGRYRITVSINRPYVKPVYVKHLLHLLDEMGD